MGRKPNTIVSQYFHRGAKLSDSSNRYEHTCRYCATHFPKGRLEAMKTHLVEECSMIPRADRQRAVDDIGDSHERKRGPRAKHVKDQPAQHHASSQNSDMDLSALQTLAEVSRQHMDVTNMADQAPATRSSKKRKIARPDDTNMASGTEEANTEGSGADTNRRSTTQQIVIDPLLNGNPAHHLKRSFIPGEPYKASTSTTNAESTSNDGSPSNRPAPSGFLIDFRLEPAWGATNVRSRFSPSRKKEVGAIRKKGACVRCRMLKKPCSGGDPCDTCKVKGSRRLWKQQCIRTRLAEELDIFDARVPSKILSSEVNGQAVEPTPVDQTRHSIVMSHFDGEHAPFASVMAMTHQCAPFQTPGSAPSQVECIDSTAQDTMGSVHSYVQQCPQILLRHTTPIEHSTFQRALSMNAFNPDELLTRSASLWTATHLLTNSGIHWHVQLPDLSGASHSIESVRIISAQINLSLTLYAQTTAQGLASSLEKRLLQRHAASSSQFETMIVSVTLLLCITKLAWYYDRWIRTSAEAGAPNHKGAAPTETFEQWPLAEAPDYIANAERVANIIITLVRVRGISPTTFIDRDDVLRTLDGTPASPLDEVVMDNTPKTWLDDLALKATDTKKAMDLETIEGCEYDLWEKRVLGRLLMPEE